MILKRVSEWINRNKMATGAIMGCILSTNMLSLSYLKPYTYDILDALWIPGIIIMLVICFATAKYPPEDKEEKP